MAAMAFPGQQYYFYNGGNYKFSSVVDGSVLDVSGGKAKEGAKLITWDWGGGPNQKFTAVAEGSGFRLEPQIAPSKGKVVLDEDQSKQLLILYTFSGSSNQQWQAEPVPNGEGAVVIVNLATGHCLRNIGHGKQVKCSPKAFEDRSIWWYMTSV